MPWRMLRHVQPLLWKYCSIKGLLAISIPKFMIAYHNVISFSISLKSSNLDKFCWEYIVYVFVSMKKTKDWYKMKL